MPVNYIYPANIGTADTYAFANTWANRANYLSKAFTNVSVNPILLNPAVTNNPGGGTTHSLGTQYEGKSAQFYEIRKSAYDVGSTDEPDISNHNPNTNAIVNRILPSTNPEVLENYMQNKQDTQSFKLRCFDKHQTITGQKVGGSSAPDSGLDLENYDYFVLINPEISDDTSPTIRPHFAKIKSIITYDEYGDGFEFEPRYPTAIPEGTNFEVYKGPAVTNTNIVAVSYGLRGDTAINTTAEKYDGFCSVSRPNWYFYEDRLDIPNQLNYDTKYLLTTVRWFKDWTTFGTTGKAYNATGGSQLWIGSSDITTNGFSTTSFDLGQSLWRLGSGDEAGQRFHAGIIIGRDDSNNTITLDQVRTNFLAGLGVASTVQYGRTIHRAVFKTEKKYNSYIHDLGTLNQNAVLVDNTEIKDEANNEIDRNTTYTFNPSEWANAFRNHYRNAHDRTSEHTSFNATGAYSIIAADLSGPSRYLCFKDSQNRNNGVTNIISPTSLNSPQNRITQAATVTSIDESGIKHIKMKENNKLVITTSLHRGSLSEYELPYLASTDTTSGQNIILQQILEGFDARNDSFLSAGDIIRFNNMFYRVSSVAAPTADERTQAITVDKKKLINGSTWEAVGTLPVASNKSIFVRAWNGGLTGSMPIDTEGVYSSNSLARLTINNKTISKTKTRLYNDKLMFLNKAFYGHNIPIDYGDSVNGHVKLQNPNKKFYVPSNNISFLYYMEGNYSIEETVFEGSIEDVSTRNENGHVVYTVTGRDDISSLLDNTINKNLERTSDIVYSTVNPMLDFTDSLDGTYPVASVQNNGITVTDSSDVLQVLNKYDLVFYADSGNKFLGEVASVADNSGTTVITFTHNNRTTITSGNRALKFHRLGGTQNYITATKAMGSNIQDTIHTTDLSHLGNNGVSFITGLKNLYSGTTNTKTDLLYSSSTGKYSADESLGYDISSIKGISRGKDSCFAFKLANETRASTTIIPMQTISSISPYTITNMNTKDEANSLLTLAPTFPLVLGSLESNASDTLLGSGTGVTGVYLVNSNLPQGGFLHKLSPTIDSNYFFGDSVFRYTGLNRFKPGTIRQTYDSVYNDSDNKQNIQGYASAYKIDYTGSASAITADNSIASSANAVMGDLTHSQYPLRESNLWTGTHMGLTGGSTDRKAPTEYVDNLSAVTTTPYELENIDYRAKKYEILGLGDFNIDSKLRHNNIGFAADSHEFTSFGLMLEDESVNGPSTSHTSYTGSSSIAQQRDADFDTMTIKSASITPSNMKRFGIMRLVEATFDWHFNPIDYESLPSTDKLEKLNHFKYPRLKVLYAGLCADFSNVSSSTTGYLTIKNAANDALSNVTLLAGDTIHRGKDGTVLAVAHQTITNDATLTLSNNTSNQIKLFYDAANDTTGDKIYIVRPKLFNTISEEDGQWGLNDLGNNGIYMPNVYLAIPYLHRSYIRHHLLKGASSSDTMDAHNLWISMIGESIDGLDGTGLFDYEDGDDRGQVSAFHQSKDWTGISSETYFHPSRVINGITRQTFGTNADAIQYMAHNNIHIFESCNVLFKDMRKVTKQRDANEAFTNPTSAVIDIDADNGSMKNTWSDSLGTIGAAGQDDVDQHSRVLRVNQLSSPDMALLGTKTRSHFLGQDSCRSDNANYGDREQKHSHSNTLDQRKGDIFQAQAAFKPKIDFSTQTINADNFTITLDVSSASSINSWIDFVPNLTGYYLVSDKLVGTNITLPDKDAFDGSSTTNKLSGEPIYVGKIISHSANTSGTYVSHTVKLDKTLNTSTHGKTFRLMRISETTFKDTPDFFDINKIFDTGLQYKYLTQNFITGEKELSENTLGDTEDSITASVTNDDLIYEEGLFAMYLVLDVDNIGNGYVERRTLTAAKSLFTNGQTLECHITDGENNETKFLNVESSTNRLRFTYDGTLSFNGIVSFGETFTITTHVKPKLTSAKRAYIGSTFIVGTDAETAIEQILEENDIEMDFSEKDFTYTNNIVSQNTTGTTITLENNAIGLSANDNIYNQDGKFIGKVASTSTNTITLAELDSGGADIEYKPKANDEIIVYNRKPLIVSSNFREEDVFGAVNSLAAKKGLEYQFVYNSPGKMQINKIDEYDSKRKFDISYKKGTVLELENNTSLFDKANKVIVIGDNVKAEVGVPKPKGNTKALKVVDPNIKNIAEARIKAEKLLAIHNSDAKKITLKMDKKGFELMKAGDLVTLSFENHNIKNEEFTVFEIENVMSGITTVTVGTFNKTIAERLSELGQKQQSGFGTLFSKNAKESVKVHYSFDDILLKENSLKYQITTPQGTVIGWTTTIGHISTIGAGNDIVTTTEIKL